MALLSCRVTAPLFGRSEGLAGYSGMYQWSCSQFGTYAEKASGRMLKSFAMHYQGEEAEAGVYGCRGDGGAAPELCM